MTASNDVLTGINQTLPNYIGWEMARVFTYTITIVYLYKYKLILDSTV